MGNFRTAQMVRLLAGAAMIAPVAVAAPAHAQAQAQRAGTPAAADDTTAQEVVVTGLRRALETALDIKRDTIEIVDVINAQDLADFPDANLAESLQRLPGVSIDRDNGEGRTITVRGLGGDFNITRLNGLEALSTAGANDAGTSPNRSRAFDYNTFASELFSQLKVQKTATAKVDEGSLGATIDLISGRPFDYKGTQFALSAQANYQENSKKTDPRIAGLASTRFFGDRMGILVSGAYSRSNNEIDQYQRLVNSFDYLYRASDFTGNENPQRGGFSAPVGTDFGTAVTNPTAIDTLTGSNPAAYAALYPGAPYNTPGRFDDSLVRIPALAQIQQQNVRNNRLGLTASYQWKVSDRTTLSIDGLYSRFRNLSTKYQIQTVGLNRNNTNATYNTAGNNLTPIAARALYPGLCVPNAGSDITPAQDCGQQMYGTTPAFSTALDANNQRVASILGSAAIVPGATNPTNANIFSVNPNNLDPYDYFNNPNSVGYIPSSNRLAYRGDLIGRPGTDVLEAHVTNGTADYLVLRNVDWRSAADQQAYTTKFYQYSSQLDHRFSDALSMRIIGGASKSTNSSQGLLVEYNRMNSPESFVYDARGDGPMPVFNLGFDAANPNNWEVVKGFSGMRNYVRDVTNKFRAVRADFDWQVNDDFKLSFGGSYKRFDFSTTQLERNNDLLNPTLKELGTTSAATGQLIEFGQGLKVSDGTATSFWAPDISKFSQAVGFDCNCINKWGDFRITAARNNTATFDVSEEDIAGYLQSDFSTYLFGARLRGNAGIRVVNTRVVSDGRTTVGRPIQGTNNYTEFLPSLNLNYQPIKDVFIRFGASKVMARPLLANLSPSVSAISIPNNGDISGGSLTVGNPKLSPFFSTNLDLSFEWYFNRGGLLSVALFNKKISSFPQTVLFASKLSTFLDPEAIAALRLQFNNPAQLAYIDNDYDVTARQFRDAPGGYIRGIEISYQQNFRFLPWFLKNTGAIINFTRIESELNYILDPVTNIQSKGPFLNVSPRAINATLFYESNGLRARVTAAQRAGYSTTYPIAAGSCNPGLTNTPANPSVAGTLCNTPLINDFEFSKSTFNLDASLSYKITKFATFTLEGLNLTNQAINRSAYQDQPVVSLYGASGRIYRAGVRIQF